MFKALLEKNYDDELKVDAEAMIIKDRLQYEELVMFVLDFAKQNKLLISNIDLLLDKHSYWNMVQIFALNVDETAKSLVSKLCKQFDKLFLLKIFELDKEYFIEYNLRRICVLNVIKPYKTFNLYDFISPIKYIINDKISIYLLPYLVEVIHMYNVLYDPASVSAWEETYKDIKKAEVFVDKEIDELLQLPKEDILLRLSTTGGDKQKASDQTPSKQTPSGQTSSKCDQNINDKLNNMMGLLLDFLKEGQYILCSEIFDNSIVENETKRIGTIEVISSNIEVDYKKLVNYLSRFIIYAITYTKKTIYLPKETRMEKYNFYIDVPYIKKTKKRRFLTLYNNTSYELINYYVKDGLKYADPIVQLRFAYLSVWSSIIMQKTHGLHYEAFIEHIQKKKAHIKQLRDAIDLYTIKKNYLGTYIQLEINKKLLLSNLGNKSNFFCHDF